MVTIKSKREIELMREAGRVTALTHKAIEDAIKPGMTTADIDRIAEETMKKYGAVSAEKGYDPGIRGVPPYPAATCISINDEVIHGVPSSKRVIKDGDIVSVDLVINLVTPKEEIIDRMLTRRVCTNPDCKATYNIKLHPPVKEGICDKCGAPLKQRADDSDPEAIKRRLEIYEEKTSPLVEYYKNKGVLRTEPVSISINRMGKDVAEDVVRDLKK